MFPENQIKFIFGIKNNKPKLTRIVNQNWNKYRDDKYYSKLVHFIYTSVKFDFVRKWEVILKTFEIVVKYEFIKVIKAINILTKSNHQKHLLSNK